MDKREGKRTKTLRTKTTDHLSLDDAFSTFYDAKVAEGRSDRTLETYRENYRFLCDYLNMRGIEKGLRNVTTELIREYMAYLLRKKPRWEGHRYKTEKCQTIGLDPVTVNTRIKTLRTMWRFLHEEGIIASNPFATVKPAAEPEKEIEILSQAQLKKLFAQPNQRLFAGFRDYVIMNVLYDGFLRINEALGLRRSQIDFEAGVLLLRASDVKSRTWRYAPLKRPTMKLLREMLDEVAEFDTDYVFTSNYGEPLTDDQFRNRLKEHARKAGLNVRIYPHLFRHTAATHFLENGGDIRHLQMILGHADLRMVERYTHLSKTAIKEQHDKYSPISGVLGALQKDRKIKR